MTKERIHYFDLAKGIGIILVVLGHLEFISMPLRYFIVSFHMPMFFIISGMLIQITCEESKDRKEIVKRKFKRMMIPYISFSILYFFIEIIYFKLTGLSSWETIFDNLYQSVCLHGVSVLWFLPAIFFGEIMFLFIRKRFSHTATVSIVFFLSMIMYFANNGEKCLYALYAETPIYSHLHYLIVMVIRCFFSMAFICIGYYLYYLIKDRKTSSPWELLLGIAFMGITVYLSQVNGGVDLHFLVFSNVFLYLATSVLGSMGVILICRSLERFSHSIPCRIIEYYGVNSLIVMATHINSYVLYFCIIVSMHFNKYITHAKNYIFCTNIMILVFISEFFVIEIINRFFPFFVGKPMIKRK